MNVSERADVRKKKKGKSASRRGQPLVEGSGKRIVLAGNPNVGKSVIFNALTGMSADVSNYPGTTIDIAFGEIGEHQLADTPGVYGISSLNDEERTARKMILEAEVVVNVVSALSLDRDLFLTHQLIEMGKPLLLVLNQWDEAVERSINIDIEALSSSLGVPAFSCVAVEGKGIDSIKERLAEARPGFVPPELYERMQPLIDKGVDQSRALLALEGDSETVKELEASMSDGSSTNGEVRSPKAVMTSSDAAVFSSSILSIPSERASIYTARRQRVDKLISECVTEGSQKAKLSVRLGRFLLHPVYGGITSLLVCYFIFYQVLGVWIAGDLVNLTEKEGFQVYYEPHVRRFVGNFTPVAITAGDKTFEFPGGIVGSPGQSIELDKAISSTDSHEVKFDFWKYPSNLLSVVGNVLVGEYGILTLTVTYLLGLLFPLVLGFYLGLSLLEDSGYLPRLAVLVDRMMNKIGLNGRAIIPLILGLGCVTMATITTRLLTSNREKLIATALLGIAIPCSAQLGVVAGTLARSGGFVAWAVYGTFVFAILAVTGLLLNMILPGKSQPLMIDLPPMRLPRADNVLKKTWKKSWNFLKEATPMFILAGLVVTVAQMIGLLDLFIRVLQPIVVNWLRLPDDPRIPTTFILGIVRRDFAAFGLTDVALTPVQAVTAMIVITLFVPCIATVGVMIKERGPKVAFTIWIGSWICAFVFGGVLAIGLPYLFALFGM